MTELLSREKQFLKLNEELDKLATSALEQQLQNQKQQHQQQPTVSSGRMAPPKTETRFLTYTKGKGPSTLLKKRGDVRGDLRGAGDCGGDENIVEVSTGTLKTQNRVGNQNATSGRDCPSRQARVGKSNGPPTHTSINNNSTAGSVSTAAAATTTRQEDDNISIANSQKDGSGNTPSTATTSHRRSIKSPESSTRTYSRTSNRASTTNATFTVKYRNPKFVESPSLEVLVKDESAQIRHGMQSVIRTASTDLESVTSNTTNAVNGGSSSRRIQGNSKQKQVRTDGLIKFLKSKITILEEDHERISQEMTQQKELLEKALERQRKVEQQRDQAYSKHNALTEQLTKVESQLEESNRRMKDRLIEQTSQQKELEIAKRELKVLTQTNTNLEKRLYRANEDLENTKNALTLMKNAERDLKETIRTENEGKDKQIKSLKKQRADLLNAYKKQLFLIDNLKRQNICFEQSKMIAFGEKEFTKVLEWNTKG